MIGVRTHHWAKTDKVDEARKLLDRNGEAQSKAPGFVNRQTLYGETDPTKITTLVVWTSLANQRPLPEVLDGNRLFYSYSFLNWTRVAPFLQFDQTVAPLAWIVHVTESAALMRAAAKLMLVVVSLLVLRPWAEQA